MTGDGADQPDHAERRRSGRDRRDRQPDRAGGAKPGARERAGGLFHRQRARQLLRRAAGVVPRGAGRFSSAYAAQHGADAPFSAAPEAQQIAWLEEVDETPFFLAVRRLTVLGLLAMPKYGGNHDMLGWKLIGVEDNHFWEPPFGYYDQNYPGFEPYPGTQPYTA
jgi:hypothetical protein